MIGNCLWYIAFVDKLKLIHPSHELEQTRQIQIRWRRLGNASFYPAFADFFDRVANVWRGLARI
jgi:hypothetical protein